MNDPILRLPGGVLGGGAGEWSPATPGNLVHWMEISAETALASTDPSVPAVNNDPVVALLSEVGADWSSPNSPTLKTGVSNGEPGLQFNDTYNEIRSTLPTPSPTATVVLVTRLADIDNQFILLYDIAYTKYLIVGVSGSGTGGGAGVGVGTPAIRVNGVSADFSTRGTAFTALDDKLAVVVCENVDFSTWSTTPGHFCFGNYGGGGWAVGGHLHTIGIYSGSIGAHVPALESYLTAKYGVAA